MSNFQRTRSKVWWGDSPPNIGSPVAHASNWENRRRPEDDWEPQLPHWAPLENGIPQQNESPPLPAINVWSPRQNSPGSHKSQDSGFSDSDSSPPTNQQNNSKPKKNDDSTENTSDNQENHCCKQNEQENNEFKTPAKKDLSNNVLNYLQTPKSGAISSNKYQSGTPIRSLIKTPKDLKDYLEAQCDIGHRSFDSLKQEDEGTAFRSSSVKVFVTPHKNINNNNIVVEKCSTKKNLLDTFNMQVEEACQADGNDKRTLSTEITLSTQTNIEYIRVSPSHQIAVNNQPRVRSPVTRINYHPPVHFVAKEKSPGILSKSKTDPNIPKKEIKTNTDDEYTFKKCEHFQRQGLNRSFNYSAQRLDEQILDEGPHSLGYIEVMRQQESVEQDKENITEAETGVQPFSSRKMTDSLHLKAPKKTISRTKQKIQHKATKTKQSPKINKSFFNFLPKRNESIKTIYDITKGSDEVDRVPSLGLPKSNVQEDWTIVDVQNERFIETYEERSTDENRLNSSIASATQAKSPKGILKTSGTTRKITPPIQFQDENFLEQSRIDHNFRRTASLRAGILDDNTRANGYSMRRVPSNEDIHFCEQELNAACTSTPKSLLSPRQPANTPGRQSSKIRPVNLLSNFNESAKASSCDILNTTFGSDEPFSAVEKVGEGQPPPVQHWLCDLVGLYEPECMTTLQSKAIGVEIDAKVANSSATITGNIRKVQTHGQIIAHQFKQVMKDLQTANIQFVRQCHSDINVMIANINEFILAHSITLKIKPPKETPDRWNKITHAVENNIQRVMEITEDVTVELNDTNPEMNVLQRHLTTLLDIFIETARAVLVQQMRTLVSMLEEPPSDMILKSTLTSLGHLGALMSPEVDMSNFDMSDLDGDAMRFITELPFVECGVPRALLSVIIESNKSSIKALSLRALATICITGEAAEQFEEAGGIEILSDILSEDSNPEPQMREAVTVLTQITAPWLQGDYKLIQLDTYLEKIIRNLTEILSRTSCCQLLLLCTACLVNLVNVVKKRERQSLSSRDSSEKCPDIIEILSRNKTIESLLQAVKMRGPSASVFLQEQTATLLNSVSSSSRGRLLLAACPAAPVALVCFLRSPRASPARPARLQAEFRLVNHAAEALARVCTIPEVTSQIIQLEGVCRLVRVIKAQKQLKTDGKCSDQILANCLRALRAIAKINKDCFNELDCDVTDMIRPTLMESVKIYSAKQESYV